MDLLELIKTRHSVRSYNNQTIECDKVIKLISAGISAPSGKNGQPWKFRIVTNKDEIESLSQLSIYGNWMKKAGCFIVVFLDEECSYHYVKDVQSCGAAIQNILLAAHAMQIGGCWIGEIIDKSEQIKSILNITNNNLILMGLITLGYTDEEPVLSERRNIDTFLV